MEQINEFSVLKCPSDSLYLNPIEHIWDVVENPRCTANQPRRIVKCHDDKEQNIEIGLPEH